jgi:hypothetical protein
MVGGLLLGRLLRFRLLAGAAGTPGADAGRSALGWSVGRENRAGRRHLAVDEP